MSEDFAAPTTFVAPTLEELAPLFPAYEIEAFIAQGGMGAVYKAQQKSLDRPVAIKILPREFGEDAQFRESFKTEAKAMARLNHPNLIGVYDFGDADGMLFIVMEYVQGKALYYSSHQKAIDPPIALDLIAKISRGLAHAHHEGILHRDIKPANILLDISASPKIGDFGLARPLDHDRSDSIVFGTPGYTAPEVYNQQHVVDQRSDIFSIGAMLFELIKGHPPQEHDTRMTTGLDARLDTILQKATHPDPNQRYTDADALADELEALAPKLSGPLLTSKTLATPAPVIAPLPSSKSSPAPLIVTLFILLVGGGIAYFAISGNQPQDETPDDQVVETTPPKKDPTPPNPPKEEKLTPPKPPKNETARTEKPPMPEPPPEPVAKKETPLDSLERLQSDLEKGKRDEFPIGTLTRNGSAYFLYTGTASWPEAHEIAQQHGASLASLKNAADLKWVKEQFQPNATVWVGATDAGAESKWYWVNGSTVDPLLWAASARAKSTAQDEDFAGLSSKGLEDFNAEQEFPALFEWKLDGTNPGSEKAQIARTATAIKAKKPPVFPSSVIQFEGSRYIIVQKSLRAQEALKACEKAGAHLAVLSSKAEADYLKGIMDQMLKKGDGCWFGAYRSEEDEEVWETTTGEIFNFYAWIPGNPDNHKERESVLEYTFAHWSDQKGYNDADPTKRNQYYLLEWSHPSQRNLPGLTTDNTSDHLEKLEAIRANLRNKHGREHKRFQRRHNKVISDWVRDTTKRLRGDRNIPETAKDIFTARLKEYEASNELPDSLPNAAPRRYRRAFRAAKNEIKELWENYKEDFEEALADYTESLQKAGAKALRNGENDYAKILQLESTAVEEEHDRLHQILEGSSVIPLPKRG